MQKATLNMETLEVKFKDFRIANASRKEHGSLDRHYEPNQLSPTHQEILRRLSLGLTNKEVAEQMGVTTATVIYVKYSRAGQIALKQLGVERDAATKELRKKVQQLGPLAADTVEDLLLDSEESGTNKGRLALAILEMNGLSRNGNNEDNKHLTDSIISSIKNNAINSGLMVVSDSDVEDAEIVESTTTEKDKP